MNAAAEYRYMQEAWQHIFDYGYTDRDRDRDIDRAAKYKTSMHHCWKATRRADFTPAHPRWEWNRDTFRRARHGYLVASYRVIWYDMLHG